MAILSPILAQSTLIPWIIYKERSKQDLWLLKTTLDQESCEIMLGHLWRTKFESKLSISVTYGSIYCELINV